MQNSAGNEKLLLSIIIVNYRSEGVLLECLTAVSEQITQIPTEIIVVDNSCQFADLKNVIDLFPQVNLIVNSQNWGFAVANNQGLANVRGKYVLFLNPDSIVMNDAISKMIDFMESDLTCVAIGPRIVDVYGNTWNASARRCPTLWRYTCDTFRLGKLFPKSRFLNGLYYGDWDKQSTRNVDCLVGAVLMVRKFALDRVGWFDEAVPMYLDNVDLSTRLKSEGMLTYYPNAEVRHYYNASGKTVPIEVIQALLLQGRYIYSHKHLGSWQAHTFAFLCALMGVLQFFVGWTQFALQGGRKTNALVRKGKAIIHWYFVDRYEINREWLAIRSREL